MRNNWTQEEIDYMNTFYSEKSTKSIAEHLGRSYSAVCTIARNLKLKKSEAFMNSDLSGRSNLKKGDVYRFKAGHIPWQKGKKLKEILTDDQLEKVKTTWFSKGNLPHNTKSDGQITIRTNSKGVKYQFIRLALGKWNHLHRHVWEEANGPIPPGSIVIFKDGNTMNAELDNLQCITKADNVIRNSINRYPDEVKKLIRTNHKLKKQIKIHHEKSSSRP